ncbi:hypothetical protein G195_011220, partial [Phytophthora kernoviae 00238/432]
MGVIPEEKQSLVCSDVVSETHSTNYGTKTKDPYGPSKDSDFDLEDGALRAGLPPRMLSPEVLALLTQYAGIGFIDGV